VEARANEGDSNSADNYTSHSFTRLFWWQFETHIDHTFPLLPMSGEDEDVGNTSTIPEHSDEEASVWISPHVGLVLKGSAITDYASQPLELDILSLLQHGTDSYIMQT
jgi:hypothetical protein